MPVADNVNDFLMGGGSPSAKFPTIGTVHKGTVIDGVMTQQTTLEGELKVWPDGNPMMQSVITIQTDERDSDIPDDDGRRRLFAKSQMAKAIQAAVRQAGEKELVEGGTLAVRYDADGEKKMGKSAPKIYTAQYAPPSAVADNLFATPDQAAPPVGQPAASLF